jgi:ABC-type phosphate transport system substrate-binding protein
MNDFIKNCATASLLFVASTIVSAAPALIVNKSAAAEKLDAATVKAIFLGKKVTWDSAGRVTVVVLKGGSVAEEFLKAAVDLPLSAFNNHWRRLAMTGGGTSPKSFEKEEELRRFVADTPGAIGFLDSANVDGSVVAVPSRS